MNILLIHQYAGNKGDRAVLLATCRLLKEINSDYNIIVSTSDPELWQSNNYFLENNIHFIPSAWDFSGVLSFKLYWKILEKFKKYTFTLMRESYLRNISLGRFFVNPDFYKAVKKSDIVISVGGHHFTTLLSRDLVSNINYDAMAVKSQGKNLICFSQSFGPFIFHNYRNKILTQKILKDCVLLPREKSSEISLNEFLDSAHNNILLTYETVLSLSRALKYKEINDRENIAGIAIYCTQRRDKENYNKYVSDMAAICDHAISKGFKVKFFPMELKGSGPDDRYVISEIISKTEHPSQCYVVDNDLDTLDHLKEVSKCKVFIGHKTHSTIFALAVGTPLIAIAYHPKTQFFLKQFDLSENVIDDKNLTSKWLTDRFDYISSNLECISKKEYTKSLELDEMISGSLQEAINRVLQK